MYKITYLDLCHTSIYKQFDTGDITAVIRSEERDDFRDFVRTSHPPQWHGGYKARLELLNPFLTLRQTIEARCVDRTSTDGVDSDLAVFKLLSSSSVSRIETWVSFILFSCLEIQSLKQTPYNQAHHVAS